MFWLLVSKLLRKLHLHQLLHLIQGINQFKNSINILMVNPRITIFLSTEKFHLFGYRKKVYEVGK